ncbi:MAG: hypothetical protein WDW36_002733 [Sanguina aurantia]
MSNNNQTHHAAGSLPLTSDAINYMVYRYLQESGFSHSAFTFGHESNVLRIQLDPNTVAPGTLVTFVQKGLQYVEMEANIDGDGDMEGEFKMLTAEEMLTQDVEHLRQLVVERKQEGTKAATPHSSRKDKGARGVGAREKQAQAAAAATTATPPGSGGPKGTTSADQTHAQQQQQQVGADGPSAAAAAAAVANGLPPAGGAAASSQAQAAAAAAAAAAAGGPSPMQEDAPSIEVSPDCVITLQGHESEVYICAWSPTEPLLASGSGDSDARIWSLSGTDSESQLSARSLVLHHEVRQDKSKDVTTLDWNHDGSLLATGSYDGLARIWTREGKLKQTLDKHQGPIFALKWNKKGDLLLSGSVDKTAIVWDAKAGDVRQIFDFHTAPTLDVDWRSNNSFATCSTDKLIHVCKLGEKAPTKTFSGHEDEVNAIKWDPSGRLLASCSDDRTAKVWSTSSDRCVHDFTDHTREIYTIKWSSTGPGTANPNLPLLLASASFDTTVRLWDVESGRATHCLARHTEPVYSVAFSPNGLFVATGSFDKSLHIWSVGDGRLVKTFKGEAGIYEVCWNREGNRVAACFANRTVCVVDIRL